MNRRSFLKLNLAAVVGAVTAPLVKAVRFTYEPEPITLGLYDWAQAEAIMRVLNVSIAKAFEEEAHVWGLFPGEAPVESHVTDWV